MSRVAAETCPPPAEPIADEQRDAWLDDVRRWYYGGMEPLGDADTAALQPMASSQRVSRQRHEDPGSPTALPTGRPG